MRENRPQMFVQGVAELFEHRNLSQKKKFEKFKHMQLSCLAKIYYFSTRFNQPKNSRTCSHTIEWIKRKANRFLTCQCPPRTIFRNEANNFYIFSYIELRSMMNAHASNAGSTKRLSQYHQLIAIFKLNAIYLFFHSLRRVCNLH